MMYVLRLFFLLAMLPLGAAVITPPGEGQMTAPSPDSAPVILFFGNSLTAGYQLNPSQAFPALIQEKIDAEGWSYRTVNAGLSGETSADGLRRIDWVMRESIDVLVLELGANDALRGIHLDATEGNLQSIIDRVRTANPEVRLLIAGMMMPPNLGPEYVQRFQSMFVDLAESNHGELIPFLLEGVAGIPSLNLPDGIHPTAEGHKRLAENVWKILKPVLEERN
ncbi:MAG: arylesterase [Acidobacteriota bacterium]|nr:arylesterase [Acidobacteriota bacterium]